MVQKYEIVMDGQILRHVVKHVFYFYLAKNKVLTLKFSIMSKDVGSLVFLKLDDDLVVGQTSLSYASACDMIEISSKDSGRAREYAAGKTNETISVGGIGSPTKEATNSGYWELYAKQKAGAKIAFIITKYTDKSAGTPVVGDESISGECFISNLTKDDNDNEAISYSCDLQVTGETSISTNA